MAENKFKVKSTEDIGFWYDMGEKLEKKFCNGIAQRFGIDAKINPEKKKDKTVPDLILNNKHLADLKYRATPFFTCKRYDVRFDPRTTVTFDEIDVKRYMRKYPDLYILFYVNWDVLTYHDMKIDPLIGLWGTTPRAINRLIELDRAKIHYHKRRREDRWGNSKANYLISLDDLHYFKPKK